MPELNPEQLTQAVALHPLNVRWPCKMLGRTGCSNAKLRLAQDYLEVWFDWL
jgi:hypothetical protein